MKRGILIICCLRTNLGMVAGALKRANCFNYPVLAWIDYGPKQKEVIAALKEMLPMARRSLELVPNGQFYLRRSLERAFAELDELVVLEDDIVLSSDAILLADWFFGLNHKAVALNLFNHSRGWEPPDIVAQSRHFCPWGWAVNRVGYDRLKPFLDMPGPWDTNFNLAMRKWNWRVLCPLLSRSLHAGRIGDHQDSSKWDTVYARHVRADGYAGLYNLRMTIPEGHLGVEEHLT